MYKKESIVLFAGFCMFCMHCACSTNPSHRLEAQRMKDLYEKTCEDWNKLRTLTEGDLSLGERYGPRFFNISLDTSIANFLTFPDGESYNKLLTVTDTSYCLFNQTNAMCGVLKFQCILLKVKACVPHACSTAVCLSFGPIEKYLMFFVTSACARRTGAAARVERRRRER